MTTTSDVPVICAAEWKYGYTPPSLRKRMKTGTQMSPPPMPTSVPNVPTPMPSNRKRRI